VENVQPSVTWRGGHGGLRCANEALQPPRAPHRHARADTRAVEGAISRRPSAARRLPAMNELFTTNVSCKRRDRASIGAGMFDMCDAVTEERRPDRESRCRPRRTLGPTSRSEPQ
jgi:hypothetical protein